MCWCFLSFLKTSFFNVLSILLFLGIANSVNHILFLFMMMLKIAVFDSGVYWSVLLYKFKNEAIDILINEYSKIIKSTPMIKLMHWNLYRKFSFTINKATENAYLKKI